MDTITTKDTLLSVIKRAPINELGLPTAIYREDFLPDPPDKTQTTSTAIVPLEYYDCAKVIVDYSEGFPSIKGSPLWHRFDFESLKLYKCFEIYLTQGSKGARQLFMILDHEDCPKNVSLNEIQSAFDTYFWRYRVKAHDMFYAAHRDKERQQRAIQTGDNDYFMSKKLYEMASCYIEDNGDELLADMTNKGLLDFIKLASQLGRLGAGLPAQGPAQDVTHHAETASVDVIMKTIAKTDGTDVERSVVQNTGNLEDILEDEDSLALAQELVIKINDKNRVNKTDREFDSDMETL